MYRAYNILNLSLSSPYQSYFDFMASNMILRVVNFLNGYPYFLNPQLILIKFFFYYVELLELWLTLYTRPSQDRTYYGIRVSIRQLFTLHTTPKKKCFTNFCVSKYYAECRHCEGKPWERCGRYNFGGKIRSFW